MTTLREAVAPVILGAAALAAFVLFSVAPMASADSGPVPSPTATTASPRSIPTPTTAPFLRARPTSWARHRTRLRFSTAVSAAKR